MARGWASPGEGLPKSTIEQLPNSKVIQFNDGDFSVTDLYFVTDHSTASTGLKTIHFRGDPVWAMHYGGRYARIAIPFLKECLRISYKAARFHGGRGPNFVRGDRFTYVNQLEYGSFQDFKGREEIFDFNEDSLGYHWYRGGLL